MAVQRLEHTILFEKSKAYWMGRLPNLPLGPELPYVDKAHSSMVHRHTFLLKSNLYNQLRSFAGKFGLTPAVVLCRALVDAIGMFSSKPHFSVVLNAYNRIPFHPEVESILGTFYFH